MGLSVKSHTDDVRESPTLSIIPKLAAAGARLRVYDPVAADNARSALSEWNDSIVYMEENYQTLEGADALLLMTEWPLFRRPDFLKKKELLKHPLVFDGRNQYSPASMKSMGFEYICIGRC